MSPVTIVGSGGHARVLRASLQAMGHSHVQFAHSDDVWKMPKDTPLVMGIGLLPNRETVTQALQAAGFESWHAIIDPSAVVRGKCAIAAGAQVLAGVVLQPGAEIGRFAICNTASSVDHDSFVGDFGFLGPGSRLCGGSKVHARGFVGAGAVVLPGVEVFEGATLGAGGVATKNIPPGEVWAGVPARRVKCKQQ